MDGKRTSVNTGRPMIRLGLTKAAFIIVLTFLFLLLAKSMVRHRFCTGGPYNNPNNAATQ